MAQPVPEIVVLPKDTPRKRVQALFGRIEEELKEAGVPKDALIIWCNGQPYDVLELSLQLATLPLE